MTERREGRMPAVFAGHGSPTNAIDDNAWRRAWRALGERLPRPRAVLCVSAHWETDGVRVTDSARPPTIHDFGGFSRALHEFEYPAPGDPALARRVAGLLDGAALDPARGLDHGAWSVLAAMLPRADVPVLQLSLERRRDAAGHFALGARLAPLRDEGVLVLGTGNVVHDLASIAWGEERGYEWAERFDRWVVERMRAGDAAALVDYERHPDAARAVPSAEHFVPLLYVLATRQPGEAVETWNEGVTLGSIAMTSVTVGGLVRE
jgi:4,5-DOPA dioxygenase extradiol